jgi:hypothetical protein
MKKTSCRTMTRSERQEPDMTPKQRLTGEPILRILCKNTGVVVGFLYLWDNGDLQPAWIEKSHPDVRYESIAKAAQLKGVAVRGAAPRS